MTKKIAIIICSICVIALTVVLLQKTTVSTNYNADLQGIVISLSKPINICFDSDEFEDNTVKSSFQLSTDDGTIKVIYREGDFDALHIGLYNSNNNECIQENNIQKLHNSLTFKNLPSDASYYIQVTGIGQSGSHIKIGLR